MKKLFKNTNLEKRVKKNSLYKFWKSFVFSAKTVIKSGHRRTVQMSEFSSLAGPGLGTDQPQLLVVWGVHHHLFVSLNTSIISILLCECDEAIPLWDMRYICLIPNIMRNTNTVIKYLHISHTKVHPSAQVVHESIYGMSLF